MEVRASVNGRYINYIFNFDYLLIEIKDIIDDFIMQDTNVIIESDLSSN